MLVTVDYQLGILAIIVTDSWGGLVGLSIISHYGPDTFTFHLL